MVTTVRKLGRIPRAFNLHPAAIQGFWRELVKSVRFWNVRDSSEDFERSLDNGVGIEPGMFD
jgi:hypothetical protein